MSNEAVLLVVLAMLLLTYQWGGWPSVRSVLVGLGIAHVIMLFLMR